MVQDIFGNEHKHYRIIATENYHNTVPIEDLDTHDNWLAYREDVGLEVKKPTINQKGLNHYKFDREATKQMKLTQFDVLNRATPYVKGFG